MKKRSLIDKLLYVINVLFAFLLLLSLVVPYIPPVKFPLVSVLSLVVAPLILIQLLFLGYWTLSLKRQLLLPLVILAICFVQFNSFYRIPFFSSAEEETGQSLKIMSYNVRSFNVNEWLDIDSASQKIARFVTEENADIVSFQEFHKHHKMHLPQYPYQYVQTSGRSKNFGQAIFSKYPIVNKGSLQFEDTGNNAIFADVQLKNDTIRVYNLHMESLSLVADDLDFNQEASKKLVRRISNAFQKQQLQMDKVVAHKEQAPFKTIITSDLNNTAFSYTYRKIMSGMNDAFAEAGSGLGTTFVFKRIPLRIDFILVDNQIPVTNFTTHTQRFSDHYPVTATLRFE